MNLIIEKSLKNSISYYAYRDLVNQLAKTNTTSGANKTEALANYTKLNDRRMKRWDKTVKIPIEAERIISEFNNKLTWLVITESWCGDAAHVIPVLNKMAVLNDNINLQMVFRDDNPELMHMFLTNGNQSIPKVIIMDSDSGDVLATYGPRPSEATSYVNRFKTTHGKLTDAFKQDLQHWYNANKGQNIVEDIVQILGELQPSNV